MSTSPRLLLERLVQARADAPARAWLADACGSLCAAPATPRLSGPYAAAPRRLGREPLELTAQEAAAVRALDADVSLAQWTTADAARAVLLVAADAAASDLDASTRLLECVYWDGDSDEQRSWLLTLPLLRAPERFVRAAADACRTNITPLFEALACENPFPSRAFPDLHFNQLVLKALFIGVPLARIVGLERRANAELSRMAADYATEREAAGRSVPSDLELAIR